MNGLTDVEKSGLLHLFETNNDPNLIVQLANIITKNAIPASNPQEAFNIILIHSPDINTILSKRVITKEILFKYLHKNEYPIRHDFTKVALITKTLEFWKVREKRETETFQQSCTPSAASTTSLSFPMGECEPTTYNTNYNSGSNVESEFPVNVMARQFCEWFFKRYNQYSICLEDFWLDSQLDLRILMNENCIENQCILRENVLEALSALKTQYNYFFNPSMSHEGVQGRLDIHGLVLVLICGTLHCTEQCVGVFETVFSLARDPYAENNWKIKKVQLLLRHSTTNASPRLLESEAMRDVLNMPVSHNDI